MTCRPTSSKSGSQTLGAARLLHSPLPHHSRTRSLTSHLRRRPPGHLSMVSRDRRHCHRLRKLVRPRHGLHRRPWLLRQCRDSLRVPMYRSSLHSLRQDLRCRRPAHRRSREELHLTSRLHPHPTLRLPTDTHQLQARCLLLVRVSCHHKGRSRLIHMLRNSLRHMHQHRNHRRHTVKHRKVKHLHRNRVPHRRHVVHQEVLRLAKRQDGL